MKLLKLPYRLIAYIFIALFFTACEFEQPLERTVLPSKNKSINKNSKAFKQKKVLESYSLYREAFKQKDYTDAYKYLMKVFEIDPCFRKILYTDGAVIINYFMENTDDPKTKQSYNQELLQLEKQWTNCFGKKESYSSYLKKYNRRPEF